MDVCGQEASWVVLGGPTGVPANATAMAAELAQRVTMFHAGDEKFSGEWLTNFQRAGGAWQICADALRPGPAASCDDELLQEFSAQTLARLARAFAVRHPESVRQTLRDDLEALLALHAQGPSRVWKQLALALTAADLWLGTWTTAPALSAPMGATAAAGFPRKLKRELLALPAELLFCDRALPLDNPQLRQAAANALLDSWPCVLGFLLDPESTAEATASSEQGVWLQVIASWIRVLRKCLRQLPGRDETAPLRSLVEHGMQLLTLVEAAPSETVEVAQQLARWRCCHRELAELLGPLLECLFSSYFEGGRQVMLPLLCDLASDCWPRAVLNELELNWQGLSELALEIAREALEAGDSDVDAEAALELWQTLATTLREGVREQPQSVERPDLYQPEKRSRIGEAWCPSPEALAKSEALPMLFSGLAKQLLELLVAPIFPEEEALVALWSHRKTAQGVLEAWARIVGEGAAWQEATWAPLQRVGQKIVGGGAAQSDDVWREAEVVFWFSSALAASWPENATAVPVSSAVPELSAIDAAPSPWRALLWSSASGLAATAPAERCSLMVEWMLERPPMAAGSTELLAVTELPYAQALEKACRHLSGEKAHVAVGERIVGIAFAPRPDSALHDDLPRVQSTLLSAMRHAMGEDAALLCQGLGSSILPGLRIALDTEKDNAFGNDQAWLAAQALFATLATAAPKTPCPSSTPHPAVTLWEQHWEFVKNALTVWTPNQNTEQPLVAAAEALTQTIHTLPRLLEEGVKLLAQSAAKVELPDLQLKSFTEIVKHAPGCNSEDAPKAAAVLAAAVLEFCDTTLARQQALLESPTTLAALYSLLGEAVRSSPPGSSGVGPCDDKLRPLLLAQPLRFSGRGLELVTRALPECTSATACGAMLRFLARLLVIEDTPQMAAHRNVLTAALPELCAALCRALASQEHLAELEELAAVAEVLYAAADALPTEIPGALTAGLTRLEIPEWSRSRLIRHVSGRAEWPRKSEWLEHLQQIVQEWQRELRHVTL